MVLLQDWQHPAPALTLCGNRLDAASSLEYLRSLITTVQGFVEEVS